MLPRNVQNMILKGEGMNLDFKFSIADSFKIARSLVSFANASGGVLLVGVDDKGRVVGVDENEETYMLDIAASKYCKPTVEIEYQKYATSDGKVVLECKVRRGSNRPYTCREKDDKWKAYIRVEDKCRLISVVMLNLIKLQNLDEVRPIFTERHEQVIQLLKTKEGALTKNQVSKELKISYRLTIICLAELMYLDILEEHIELNKFMYFLK